MASIEYCFQLIIYHLESRNLKFLPDLKKIILSISNKVSSPTLKSHFALLAKLVISDPNKAIQFIRSYSRIEINSQTSQKNTIISKPVINMSLLNSQDNFNLTLKGFYSRPAEFVIGDFILVLCCELRKVGESEMESQNTWTCIQVKEASRCPSSICVNNSGNLLKVGQFFLVNQDIILIKHLNEQFVVLAVVNDEQDYEFKAQFRANYLIVKNGIICKTNPCFRDGFRILKNNEGWALWSNDEYCLMYLANPFKFQSQEAFDWVEIPQGVFDIWINRVKYKISIKEC